MGTHLVVELEGYYVQYYGLFCKRASDTAIFAIQSKALLSCWSSGPLVFIANELLDVQTSNSDPGFHVVRN